jgi:tetratricopeptide (TPR) repeat protein
MNKLIVFIFMIVFVLHVPIAIGSESDEIKQYQFVEYLHQNKHYFRAISEGLRFIFLYPDSLQIIDVKILIADAYEKGGDEETALKQYLEVVDQYPESGRLPEIYIKLGRLYSKNYDYQTAVSYFKKVLENQSSSPGIILKAKEWILLNQMLGDTDDKTILHQIDEFNLKENNRLITLSDGYKNLEFKSPRTAGILASILPGAGHWYIGRRWDAVASFILNGLFIWGAVESFQNDNTGLGVALTLFETGWYAGNIYGAVNGVHKYNRKLKQDFYQRFTLNMNLNTRSENHATTNYFVSFAWDY